MTTAIITLVATIATAVGGFFAYKASPSKQRKSIITELEVEEKELERRKEAIRSAVYSNDDDRLSEIAARLAAPVIILCLLTTGCASSTSKVIYIPTDRRIESCTNSIGIQCKAVPNALFEEILIKLEIFETMKRSQVIDNRLQK